MSHRRHSKPAVWFPAIRTGTGTDVFTQQLVIALRNAGYRAEISWLPSRAEYFPFSVGTPNPPTWANVVHVNSWLHRHFLRNCTLPVVVTCHGCVHDQALERYKSFAQKLYHNHWVSQIEGLSYRRATRITAVSSYTALQLQRTFGRFQVEVIPNWLSDDSFRSPQRLEQNKPFRLIYIGNLNRRKGSDLLPKIMARLGDEFELRYTGKQSALSSAQTNMHSLGWSSDRQTLCTWLESSDALIFPSRMEGMPLAVLEAMACGLPVVASNAACLPELVHSGRNGYICPVDDADAFAQAVRTLHDDIAIWRAMRKSAYQQAFLNHRVDGAVNAYLQVYESVLADPQQAANRAMGA